MKIYKAKDYKDMSRKAANIISAQVIMKPNCVLGLATGSTPIGTYDQLVEWYNKGDLDFSEVTTVNLDEYKGLPRTNDQSYYYFMHQHLFDRVNIDPERTNVPNGMEPDAEKECGRYEELIRSLGGVDLQLLGLGHNGHIGFNEPGEAFEKETHCVDLTESTIEANKRCITAWDHWLSEIGKIQETHIDENYWALRKAADWCQAQWEVYALTLCVILNLMHTLMHK